MKIELKEKINSIIAESETEAKPIFETIDKTAYNNQLKVLNAFRDLHISQMHFAPTTGYGYDDAGRDTLCKLYAKVFNAESALVSPLIVNGTHALTIALFGLVKMGSRILFVTGSPYDTLNSVLNGENIGSLKDYGVISDKIELNNNKFDYEAIKYYLQNNRTDVVYITRSRGYSWRNALSIEEIKEIVDFVRKISPNSTIMTDNCYGEFVYDVEPTAVDVDVIAGSLIKNPGGGLAPTGGYIAGKQKYIDKIANRLTSPSIGMEVGSYNSSYMPFYEGLFLAPTVVASAIKGNVLAGYVFSKLGYEVSPDKSARPNDIIRSIKFNTAEELIDFVQSIQYASPVDSHVTPYPWDMPGYDHQVIMAAGSFVQGASIELSADSPIKSPYIAYMQGGLTYEHCKIAICEAVENILSKHH